MQKDKYTYIVTKFEQIVLPKIPQNLFGRSAQLAKIFGTYEKNSHWVSVVRAFDYLQTLRGTQTKVHFSSCYFYLSSTITRE